MDPLKALQAEVDARIPGAIILTNNQFFALVSLAFIGALWLLVTFDALVRG